jgi:hypothetical protein
MNKKSSFTGIRHRDLTVLSIDVARVHYLTNPSTNVGCPQRSKVWDKTTVLRKS